MKSFIFALTVLASTQSQASPVISKVTCSDGQQNIITIERMETQEDSFFRQTTFFKPLVNGLFCLADAANVPGSIRCENANDLDAAIEIRISSADGILNMGEMTFDGQKTELFCGADWN